MEFMSRTEGHGAYVSTNEPSLASTCVPRYRQPGSTPTSVAHPSALATTADPRVCIQPASATAVQPGVTHHDRGGQSLGYTNLLSSFQVQPVTSIRVNTKQVCVAFAPASTPASLPTSAPASAPEASFQGSTLVDCQEDTWSSDAEFIASFGKIVVEAMWQALFTRGRTKEHEFRRQDRH